jgi:adenosylmethionine-8-amino-7-oxononanoate aminotransferase
VAVRDDEFVVDSGWDVWLWDADGRRCLDAAAGLCCANIGHGRHEIAQAISVQLWRVETAHHPTEPARALAAQLAERAPMPAARVLLTSSGEAAAAAAAELARRHWAESGEPERRRVLNARDAGDDFDGLSGGSVAAVVVDPLRGAAGLHAPPAGRLEELARRVRAAGALLIADASIAGFGRLGTWFGIERWPVTPDLVVFGESVTGGYLPLGGVLAGARIRAAAPAAAGGHAACCAAALKTIEILEGEHLLDRGRKLEQHLEAALSPLAAHPLVAAVRAGVGIVGDVELDPAVAPSQLERLARERGVLVHPLATSIAIAPPLTASPAHFHRVAAALGDALDEL